MDESNDLLRYSSPNDLLSTFKRMDTFRTNTQLCDVTLMAGERKIRAHRVIMAGFSDYFDAMFNGDLAETIQDVIHIRNVDPDALAAIVDYAYTGKLEIRVDNVENLLTVACLLQVENVKHRCCEFMQQHLHSTNCLGIRAFAEGHGCGELFAAADNFTKENFLQVIESKEFQIINGNQLVELFASDDLNVNTEEDVFSAMEKWVQFDCAKRKPFVSQLLENIRLPLMSCKLLTDRVEKSPVFALSDCGNDLLLEAMKYHLLPERRAQMQNLRTKPRKSNVGLLYVVGGVESYQGNRNAKGKS
ncbi:kelch 5 [Paramuricea clavata]|uniref:Kelch 5 n=1 Tax=Paramuricea clavata TaxID=317549 RepID=A0A6S7IY14_PARCT|nr:kelch 5 [Paramuricea clavata]